MPLRDSMLVYRSRRKWYKIRIFSGDIIHNCLLKPPRKIEIFEPEQITDPLPAQNCFKIRDTGNTGDTNRLYGYLPYIHSYIAAIQCSMLPKQNPISFLKFSSSVLIDHETVTRPSFFNRSISRTTRSDFVQIRISASLLKSSCSRSFLVFPNCSSCSCSHLSQNQYFPALSGIFLPDFNFRPMLHIKEGPIPLVPGKALHKA